MKLKLIILAALLSVSAWSQGSNTIYQTIATNSTAAGETDFGPVRNIGQASHQAYIVVTSRPAHSCDATQVFAQIQLFGSNVSGIGSAVSMPQITNAYNNNSFLLAQGTSVYPFVYVVVEFTDPSLNCQWSAYYAGSTQGLTLINNNISQATNYTATGGPGTLNVAPIAGLQQLYQIYGYTLATTGAAAVVNLVCTDGVSTGYSTSVSLAVGTPFFVRASLPPAFHCAPHQRLDAVVTGVGSTVFITALASLLPAVGFLF